MNIRLQKPVEGVIENASGQANQGLGSGLRCIFRHPGRPAKALSYIKLSRWQPTLAQGLLT